MGGCASKNKKQPKEEPYKPASAPLDKGAVAEVIGEVKQEATSRPVRQNGSAAEIRNSLVGPGGVILPNQPEAQDEADPSIPFMDAIEDEAGKHSKAIAGHVAKAEQAVKEKVETVKTEITAIAETATGALQTGVQEVGDKLNFAKETTTKEVTEVKSSVNEKVSDAVQAGGQEAEDKLKSLKETASKEVTEVESTVTEKASGADSLMAAVFGEVKTEVGSCEAPVSADEVKVEVKKVEDAAASVIQSGVETPESAAKDDETEFTGFRIVERENQDVAAKDEDVTKLCESVGFIYSPYYTGVGFRVGDKYIMTSHHIIKNITGQIPSLGTVTPEQKLIKSSEIWIQFDYLQMGEYEPNNPTRFSFAGITYTNKALDVAIIELEVPDDKTLPPPLASFCHLQDGSKVEFLGHNGAPSKRRTLVPQICNPTEKELQKVSSWCKSQGFEEDSYCSLKEPDRVRFQQVFAYSQCGSPGVALRGEELAAGVMLTKSYPTFFHELEEEQKMKIPDILQIDEGVSMAAIYEALKDQEQTSELCNNIFGQALCVEKS